MQANYVNMPTAKGAWQGFGGAGPERWGSLQVGQAGSGVEQYWFDDARSTRVKYSLAKQFRLRGAGPFTFSDLDAQSFPSQTQDMWRALEELF